MKSTTSIAPQKVQRRWIEVDAGEQTLGRISARISALLNGKRKAYYVPHQDCGDYVVVINADKVKVSGKKESEHLYYSHSGYPGALRSQTIAELRSKDATRLIEKTVKGMMPKTKLGKAMMDKLFVYKNEEHPHKDKVKRVEKLS